MKKILAGFMTFGVLTLGAQFAQADFLSFSDSFTDEQTELTGAPDARLMVDYFDGSLGTLTGVTVIMSASMTSAGFIENQSASPADITVSTLGQAYLGEKVTAPAVLPSPFNVFVPFTVIAFEIYPLLSVGALTPFGPGTASTGPALIFASNLAGDLAQFVDTGLFGYDFYTTILTSFTGAGGNIATQIQTVASGELEVLYEFTPDDVPPPNPVPEPATMLLLGTGLVGVVGATRRKKKNQA